MAQGKLMPTVPDRLYMTVRGLAYDQAREAAVDAANIARRLAPKLSGASAKRIMPMYGEGFFGIRWLDCLTPGHRVLRDDWRWVPVEELQPGDGLISFDEEIAPGEGPGRTRGRRYRTGRVVEMGWGLRECVEVVFDDGTSVSCTDNHPWLALRAASSPARQWITAGTLREGDSLGVYFDPWEEDRSYEAGWLAGMFDGEGCLAHNGNRGAATPWVATSGALMVSQKPGLVLDRLKELLRKMGYDFKEISSDSDSGSARSLRILGGFSEQVHLLGTIRPERLVAKIRHENRPMKAIRERVVVEVRPLGKKRVVLLETSTQTYMAEGMGSHNSYLYFQEAGIKPFTMTALAGKTIPMWIDDPRGDLRKANPKAQTRTTESGKTQVLIFRKAARIGATKSVKRIVGGAVTTRQVPQSYPGAPGRIAMREAPRPWTTSGRLGGAIAQGNVGVRWRHPGLARRNFLYQGVIESAARHRLHAGEVITGTTLTDR